MTVRARTTIAEIRRRIRAVQLEGLHVRGIAPDGTVLVGAGEVAATDVPDSKWNEVKA